MQPKREKNAETKTSERPTAVSRFSTIALFCSEILFHIWPSELTIETGRCLWYKGGMNRQEILDRLRENERALRERGVAHAALFGSRARGDNRPDSDTDIMIDIDPDVEMSVYDYVGLKRYIASLFRGRVDVVNRDALKSYVRPAATADAVYAF